MSLNYYLVIISKNAKSLIHIPFCLSFRRTNLAYRLAACYVRGGVCILELIALLTTADLKAASLVHEREDVLDSSINTALQEAAYGLKNR